MTDETQGLGRRKTKRMRLTANEWDDHFIYGKATGDNGGRLLKVAYANASDAVFAELNQQLFKGAQLNLLSVETLRNEAEDAADFPFVLFPEMLVLEPDFLLDITALCACIKPYGHSPYTHLLNKFAPPARSAAIQLGNAANQFLDDCVNEQGDSPAEEELYLRSMQNSFRNSPLAYTTLSGIDRQFFDQCKTQFHNIRQMVKGHFGAAHIDIQQTPVQLEPAFLCEALGLQGRMDLLTQDARKLIELKSGKAEEYPVREPREEHQLQMALYKEMLYYNLDLPRESVQAFLLYSRYPQIYAPRVPRTKIRSAMALRNAILHLERRLARGESRQLTGELTEERINVLGRDDRFYRQYLRPRIEAMLRPLRRMAGTEADYFHRFLAFTEREQFLAKTGDKPGVTRGKQWIRLKKDFELLDTPGILWPKFEDEEVGLKLAMIGSINDDILDTQTLCTEFINLMMAVDPDSIRKRYKAEFDTIEEPAEILEKIAVARGFIKKGGEADCLRAAKIILDEFRGGKIGRITLELPEDIKEMNEKMAGREEEKKARDRERKENYKRKQ